MTPADIATKTGKIPHIPISVSLNFHIDEEVGLGWGVYVSAQSISNQWLLRG